MAIMHLVLYEPKLCLSVSLRLTYLSTRWGGRSSFLDKTIYWRYLLTTEDIL